MAEAAVNIYDTQGEQAMLDFIKTRMAPGPPHTPDLHALIVLQDHTCIQSGQSLYNFLWMDQETFKGQIIKTDRLRNRPALIPLDQRPIPPSTT